MLPCASRLDAPFLESAVGLALDEEPPELVPVAKPVWMAVSVEDEDVVRGATDEVPLVDGPVPEMVEEVVP